VGALVVGEKESVRVLETLASLEVDLREDREKVRAGLRPG
jgi:hypothetical protein